MNGLHRNGLLDTMHSRLVGASDLSDESPSPSEAGSRACSAIRFSCLSGTVGHAFFFSWYGRNGYAPFPLTLLRKPPVPCTPDAIELRNWDRSVDCSVSAHLLAGRLGKTATSLRLAREWCRLLDHGGATRARHEERIVDGARHCRTRSGTTSLIFPRRQSAGTGIVSRSLLRAAANAVARRHD